MARRSFKRDSKGRFSRVAGAKGAAKVATRAVGRSVTRKVRRSYVKGSFEKHLVVGKGGDYKGAKVGVEFRTPAGRGLLGKAILGYHGRPDRKLDVTPTLDKPNRELTVTVRKNPAGSKVGSKPKTPPRSASSGTKMRR
ncbi:hypothetical protein [Rhodococcus sp. IEGM 1318]|uniref:hypothetical protein n=1 Tax=Rhodococcus sp. IEGM 1318 TaxID=3082226 RepID=UPI0029533A02|nr:hypothetical protein [Rhodococcus sp. IEGM 1318]MDV8008625.1 hypothetical protein [Rhodococcus sp. IEGM 1318]